MEIQPEPLTATEPGRPGPRRYVLRIAVTAVAVVLACGGVAVATTGALDHPPAAGAADAPGTDPAGEIPEGRESPESPGHDVAEAGHRPSDTSVVGTRSTAPQAAPHAVTTEPTVRGDGTPDDDADATDDGVEDITHQDDDEPAETVPDDPGDDSSPGSGTDDSGSGPGHGGSGGSSGSGGSGGSSHSGGSGD